MVSQAISPIFGFILQAIVLLSFIPVTFLAYRLLREPRRKIRISWELSQFDMEGSTDVDEAMNSVEYSWLQYVLPLGYIMLVFLAFYSMTNPYIIQWGPWKGLLEDTVNVFGQPVGGTPIARDVLFGRVMFWCWLGAYIYSIDRTVRHYLAHDLSPNVYVTIAKRFTVAFVVGSLICLAIAASNQAIRLPFDSSLVSLYVVCFFIGMFPETGIKWVRRYADKILQDATSDNEQLPLSQIDGMSLWHQGRLDQEGIENVQNLASASLLGLVANTPFDVGQVVDWMEQAILLVNTSTEQAAALDKVGIRHASDVLEAIQLVPAQLAAVTGLKADELVLLGLALESATNIELIHRFRAHQHRLDVDEKAVQPSLPAVLPQPTDVVPAVLAAPGPVQPLAVPVR